MTSNRTRSGLCRALLLAAALGLAPGCTLFDDYLPGTPFTTEQPLAQVTVDGEILMDRGSRGTSSCPAGGTVLWGLARNTGDVDVEDVSIIIDAFDAGGAFLGSFSGSVFNGEIVVASDETSLDSASTSLAVDQSGTFEVCTPISFGTVARTEYRTEFIFIQDTTQ